jgi:hypothetical protein
MRSVALIGFSRKPRPAAVLAGAALLCATLVSTLISVPAQAAHLTGTRTLRVGLVASSDSYVVFRQKRATSSGFLSPKGSALYSLGRSGGRHRIHDFDPEIFTDLKGSMLTQSAQPNYRYDPDRPYDPAAPEYVRWRDLRTGKHGVGKLPAGDDYFAAAPGGWLATRTPSPGTPGGALHVVRYTTGGAVTDLGAPFPAGVPTTVLRRGSAGVLAVSAGDPERASEDGVTGAFRYMPYDAPGKWRDLFTPKPAAAAYCDGPSKTAVVCEAYRIDPSHGGSVLIPLAGGPRRWLDSHRKACQTVGLTVVGSSAFGRATSTGRGCIRGQIVQLTSRGVLKTSKRTYGGRGGGAGLGGFLFTSKDQRKILRLTSAAGTPKVITTAH